VSSAAAVTALESLPALVRLPSVFPHMLCVADCVATTKDFDSEPSPCTDCRCRSRRSPRIIFLKEVIDRVVGLSRQV
jgi:hypothetical protein